MSGTCAPLGPGGTGRPDPQILYDDLTPLAERLVVAGTGVTCWGSTQAVLGRLAVRLNRPAAAAERFAAAVACTQRSPPDLGPLADLVAPAVDIVRAVGMPALLADLDQLGRSE